MGFCVGQYKNNPGLKLHEELCRPPQLIVLIQCHENLFIHLKNPKNSCKIDMFPMMSL